MVTIGSTRVRQLFPAEVITAEVVPSVVDEEVLFPEEAGIVRCAVHKRRQEFAAGRACARGALKILGIAEAPILPGSRNAPTWPKGVVGTITHTTNYCAAAVALDTVAWSLGLDVEKADPMPSELWPYVCSEHELSSLNARDEDELGRLVKLVFCAKECLYKCQYPVTKTFLDFLDVEILLNSGKGSFFGRFLHKLDEVACLGGNLEGRFQISGELVLAGMVLRRRE